MPPTYETFSARDAGLPEGVWAQFRHAGIPQRFEKGRIIYLQGQEPQYLYYLYEGRVRSFLASDEGEERVLAVYETGSIFGEASFFDGLPRVSSAVALTDCKIVIVDRATVMREFARDPTLALNMLNYLARTVRMLSDHVDHMSFLTADKRIVRLLLAAADRTGQVSMSQDEIAVSVGVSRVTVNRILRALAAAGLVRTGYGGVQVLDRAGLEGRME